MPLVTHEENGWIIEECRFATAYEQSTPIYRKRPDGSILQKRVVWTLQLDSDGLHFHVRDKDVTERFYRFLNTSQDCSLEHEDATLYIWGWCDITSSYDRDTYYRNVDYAKDRY